MVTWYSFDRGNAKKCIPYRTKTEPYHSVEMELNTAFNHCVVIHEYRNRGFVATVNDCREFVQRETD